MAQSNTYDTTNPGSAVSNREDLAQGAYLIAPGETPLYSFSDKVQATATYHEYTLDDMSDPDDTGVVEGADASNFEDAFSGQARVGNYLMTIERTAKVSDDQELVDNAAGVNFAGAVTKKLKELNRDAEKRCCSLTAQDAGSKTSARQAAGFGEQLGGTTGASTMFPADYEIPSAQNVTGTAVTEQGVDNVIRSIFDESGSKPNLRLYAGSGWMADFSEATMRLASTPQNNKLNINVNGAEGKIPARVRIYEGQHGMVEVFDLNSKCVHDTTNLDMAFFINPEYACVAELGGLIQKELPDLGGGRRILLRRKFAPCIKNPRAHGFWESTS